MTETPRQKWLNTQEGFAVITIESLELYQYCFEDSLGRAQNIYFFKMTVNRPSLYESWQSAVVQKMESLESHGNSENRSRLTITFLYVHSMYTGILVVRRRTYQSVFVIFVSGLNEMRVYTFPTLKRKSLFQLDTVDIITSLTSNIFFWFIKRNWSKRTYWIDGLHLEFCLFFERMIVPTFVIKMLTFSGFNHCHRISHSRRSYSVRSSV